MVNKKDRRHSGRKYPKIYDKLSDDSIDLINNYWNDWNDYRDGFRSWFSDGKKIKKVSCSSLWVERIEKRKKLNNKNIMLLKRRKVRKIN